METCHQFDSMQILVFMDGLPNEVSTINVIITMGKFLIHKCKWTKCKPTINHFKNDCKVYLESLKVLSKNNLFSLKLFNVMSTHLELWTYKSWCAKMWHLPLVLFTYLFNYLLMLSYVMLVFCVNCIVCPIWCCFMFSFLHSKFFFKWISSIKKINKKMSSTKSQG